MVAGSTRRGGRTIRSKVPRVYTGPTPDLPPGTQTDGLTLVDFSHLQEFAYGMGW